MSKPNIAAICRALGISRPTWYKAAHAGRAGFGADGAPWFVPAKTGRPRK